MAQDVNIFLRLHRWAHRQDENFTSECLALYLDRLVEREPLVALQFIEKLTGGRLRIRFEEVKTLQIVTQPPGSEGRPDIEFRTADQLAAIEVKVESPLRPGQLLGYRQLLQASGTPSATLVLVTRYPVIPVDSADSPDVAIRWHSIGEWIEGALIRGEIRDTIAKFISEEFLEFLRARNMSLTHVSWQMPSGVSALRGLIEMVAEVATICGVDARRRGQWEWIGLYLKQKMFWVGVYFTSPEFLYFETYKPIDRESAERLEIGEVQASSSGRAYWSRSVDLGSEEVHFYSRSKASQLQWLESFLRESMTLGESIVIPGAPSEDENVESDDGQPMEH